MHEALSFDGLRESFISNLTMAAFKNGVIASEAKQSRNIGRSGLLRQKVRNDA
jgi:hypothetical protein